MFNKYFFSTYHVAGHAEVNRVRVHWERWTFMRWSLEMKPDYFRPC